MSSVLREVWIILANSGGAVMTWWEWIGSWEIWAKVFFIMMCGNLSLTLWLHYTTHSQWQEDKGEERGHSCKVSIQLLHILIQLFKSRSSQNVTLNVFRCCPEPLFCLSLCSLPLASWSVLPLLWIIDHSSNIIAASQRSLRWLSLLILHYSLSSPSFIQYFLLLRCLVILCLHL